MFNDEKEPDAVVPEEHDWDRLTYDAVCRCDDTYGDYPWCPACYPRPRFDLTGEER